MCQSENCDCKNEGGEGECGCECHGGGRPFRRRFHTRAEQVEELESYLAELKLEVQAVEERLAEMRK